MVQDPLIEKLVQNAVGRCRDRAIRAKEKVKGVINIGKVAPDQAESGSFTDALKRSRGL
jgi:hypothetical protein